MTKQPEQTAGLSFYSALAIPGWVLGLAAWEPWGCFSAMAALLILLRKPCFFQYKGI